MGKDAQLVTSPQSSCVCTACCKSLEQAVNNLYQNRWHYQTCYKFVLSNMSDRCSHNITSMLQD